ncbi:MAG: VCBS repeat-containing protein [Bacteroidota bacterium]
MNSKPSSMIYWLTLSYCLVFSAQLSSAQISTTTSALLAEVSQADDCSVEHQEFNDEIMKFARIVVSTDAFEQCVRHRMRERYKKCIGDPHYDASLEIQIQKVLEAVRSLNKVHIKCTGGSGNASTHLGEYGKMNKKSFSWGEWFSAVHNQLDRRVCNLDAGERPGTHNCRWAEYPWPYSQAAGIVVHELLHTHGYTHGANDQEGALPACGYDEDDDWHFQVNTIPYIVGNCVDEIISQSASACNLRACGTSYQLQLVTSYNGSRCACVNDPGQRGIGLLEIESGKLKDEAIKPRDSWIGGWRVGKNDRIVQKGDFNGDGKEDFVVTSGWGIGILTFDGNLWRPLVVKKNGTRFGGWNFQSNANSFRGTGDFNGDGKDDLVITSGWGIAILTLSGNTLRTLTIKPKNTFFNQWRYNSTDRIKAVGDFDGDNRAEILLSSDWGVGILELRGSNLYSIMAKKNGSRFGGWNFQSRDNRFEDIGDFNGDGKDDIIITSNWGIGILTYTSANLNALMLKPKDTWFNKWRYNASVNSGKDIIRGVGDFDNDNRDEILITSSWGLGILELRGNSLYSIVDRPNGTRFGGWNFQSSANSFKGIGDFNRDGQDDIVISSNWGIGILSKSGSSLRSLGMKPNGKLVGSWVLAKTDKLVFVDDFGSGRRAKILIQKGR